MKKILVIGGSYFAGRAFNVLASKDGNFEIHTVNRGSRKLGIPGVSEFVCDRHDTAKLFQTLPVAKYDAVIDFCAYKTGDISSLMNTIPERISQYVFISTSSVYDPKIHWPKKENDATLMLETLGADNFLDEYIREKVALERELLSESGKLSIPCTIIRPNFLYGPFNYAPRESWYIQKIVNGEPIPTPVDCNTRFSFCYVADLAKGLMLTAGNTRAYNEVYNLAAPEEITYDGFINALRQVSDIPFTTKEYTVRQILEENIPLPFPLEANELLDGSKIADTFGLTYTPFLEGMAKAFKAFKKVFQK